MTKELKVLRARLDINQTEMAKRLGIGKTAYCLKEKGEREFTRSEMAKIVELAKTVDINASMDALFMF